MSGQGMRGVFCWFLIGLLAIGTVGCGDRQPAGTLANGDRPALQPEQRRSQLKEVSPPATIQKLRQVLEDYRPQVKILSPQPDELLQENRVSVRLEVKDLPIYQDPQLGLGPHLQVFVDDQPYRRVFRLDEPLILEDLSPGTHHLRAFAARPWDESFKNEGAYAQATFHVFTKTPNNQPDPNLPLITYGSPQGSYGAEPIMLDFYLLNAPLHFIAKDDSQDDIPDWRIRTTINGESFLLDRWQPIYLKGFKPGQNWLKLEFLDETGSLVQNAFNLDLRLIDYQPGGQDSLARLMRGDLSAADALGIVDPKARQPGAAGESLVPPPGWACRCCPWLRRRKSGPSADTGT
ncbi:MAG: hypothetical protein HC824_01145 [Synechococcales cyanobacterium RM1_1_8]|nr:hypothetical protein [Synechococcales cyanobacterium RM1_1_8]